MAINRYFYPTKYQSRAEVVALGIKCVFISYQKQDINAAAKVADYLSNADIDIYFDRYDSDLRIQHQVGNPKEVTKAICNGINNSSHMLVIVSPNTMISTWVPFEIGYGFDKTELRVLCLKGISKGSLPEYIRTVPIVRDIYDLNGYISSLTDKSQELLLKSFSMSEHRSPSNPLVGVMDDIISDQY